jgi:hypothetical protein
MVLHETKNFCTEKERVIRLLGMYLNGDKSGYNENSCRSMFIAALFTIASMEYISHKED